MGIATPASRNALPLSPVRSSWATAPPAYAVKPHPKTAPATRVTPITSHGSLSYTSTSYRYRRYSPGSRKVATAVATFLLPGLYLLYLYEVEVYESEPWLVIGVTLVAGAVFGCGFTAYAGGAVARLDLTGDSGSAFLLTGVANPIVAHALMLAGPLY